MLKCPHCGVRLQGQDLISGSCHACEKKLTASLDSIGDIQATIATDMSDLSSPSDPISSRLSDSEPDAAGMTMMSDVASAPVAPESSELVSAGSASHDDPSATEATFVSDEFVSEVPSENAADSSENDQTIVSDEFAVAEDQASLRTIGMEVLDQLADSQPSIGEANDKTLVSDSFAEGDGDENDKTLVSDAFEPVAAGRDNDKTYVSDDVPEALIKTIQSEWGDEDPNDQTNPGATLKAREKQEKLRGAKNTLVIKTKSLRDVKVATKTSDAEPEYELLKILGEGGMGVVYDARQTSIDRNVALKMIKGPAAENEKQKAKFLAEAVVTGDLDHPNIVPIYDVGRNSTGALFYSMKKVSGTPWDKVIAQKTLAENLDILLRVADAIAFAHDRGVVHRDLKPENTMLGEYGEVLVMDWGLAQPSKNFRKSASITETQSMGGTPAYMAPEMATGPIEKISALSDVYLLGAILYEIVTGRPPHQGKNAMKCLMAAARNEIVPTDKTGELVDIALKAMATEPVDRYDSVQSLQAAIREYQSHSESVLLSVRADEDLVAAKQSDEYPDYAKALFGFEEAYELWSGNKRAAQGIAQAQLAYAESARRKGDYDLGLSLLKSDTAQQSTLRLQILQDKQEREARTGRITALKRMAAGLAVVVFAVVSVAFFWIRYEADNARKAEKIAKDEKRDADKARDLEKEAKQQAVAAKDLAVVKQQEAEKARADEEIAKQQAVTAKDLAVQKQKEAEEARELEAIAKRAEEYEAYIARIGLAAAKINENAFETARELLDGCKPELRNWEWGRLMHLCSQSAQTFPAGAPLDALALSADGTLFATGGWDGAARIWECETGKLVKTLQHGGVYVHGVAFSADGRHLATASDDAAGSVQVWNVASGQRVQALTGHGDAALSVCFSKDGQRLLTASYDKTARLWDWQAGKELRAFQGHTWWVWQAVFSADETQIVTASQDGTAIVWKTDGSGRTPPFTGHQGPVFCASFLPDGKSIASGGFDRRILLWQTDALQAFNFRNLERGQSVTPPAKYVELIGHATAVRSLQTLDHGRQLLSAGEDNTVRLWDVATASLVKTFRGHDSGVRAALCSPDGRMLLSASHDATVRTWRIAGYEEFRALQGRKLEGHADAVLAAAYSPDQLSIVTASRDRTARTWNSRTGELQQTFEEGHQFLASTARFFQGGKRLLTAAVDNTARVWDVATGTQLLRLERTGRAAAVAITQNGEQAVTGGNVQEAQLWDLSTGKVLRTYGPHKSEVTAVALSPDEKWLLTGDAKGNGAVWDLATGEKRYDLKAHTRRIAEAAFTADGQRALTASGDNTVAQWDLATGKEITAAALKHPDSLLAMALVPGRMQVVTSASDRTLRVWDLATGKVVGTFGPFEEQIHAFSLSTDGTRLLTAQPEARVVRLWELETGREVQHPGSDGQLGPLVNLQRTGGLLWSVAFGPGEEILTVGGNEARLWDLKTSRERLSFSPHGAVASARYSPDNTLIVTGSWDNSAKIWDARTGKAIKKLEGGHTGFVNTALFHHDGTKVLTASDDGTAKLWSVATGEVLRTYAGHTDRVRAALFSRDGTRVVTTSNDKTARLWDTETGALLQTYQGHQWAVLTADLAHDGTRLITGSEDNQAKVWNVETGECLLTLAGHTAPIPSVAFSPDGSRVLTGSQDQVAKLWDARTGKEILTLSRHTEDVTSVTFSPDGKQVLTASRDGTALIWPALDWHPAVKTAVGLPVVSPR